MAGGLALHLITPSLRNPIPGLLPVRNAPVGIRVCIREQHQPWQDQVRQRGGQSRAEHESLTDCLSGFNPHAPSLMHRFLAKGLGASMWFFIFYRARYVALLT